MNRKPELDAQQAIHMAWSCVEFRTLPDPGGLFQQDHLKMWVIDVYKGAKREQEERERKSEEAKVERNRRR